MSIKINSIEVGGEKSRNLNVGDLVNINVTISNDGERTARNIPVVVQIDGTAVARTEVRRIRPGQSADATLVWLPLSDGRVRLHAVVNPEGSITESTFDDNEDRSKPLRLRGVGLADLLVTDLMIEPVGNGAPAGAMRISFTLHNVGDADSQPFQMCAHILRNARAELFGPRDQVVFDAGFQELAAGDSRSFSRTVLLENSWRRFVLLVRVDTWNATTESNKVNNESFISVRTRDLR